jgi:hypothetical protein
MAHVEKYTSGAAGRMLKHYERAPVKHRGNENIKPELTELNYNLASEDQPMPQATFVTQRLLGIAQRRAEEQERVPKTVEEFAAMMKNEQKKEQSFELEL